MIAIGIVVLAVVFAPLWGCAFDLIYWLKGKPRRGTLAFATPIAT